VGVYQFGGSKIPPNERQQNVLDMSESTPNTEFPLDKTNLLLIGIGAATVVIGFFLMSGGGADDVSSFSEEVFSFRRMYVAPIAILAGYGLVMYGIIKK